MKKIVYYSLQSVQDDVLNRSKSFTLFGYDFMLDETLNVWLLEVLTLNRALVEP
jgi:tubulin monoglycylase TTLL3/8